MVTDLKKVCKQVAAARENVVIDIDPFFDEQTTLATIWIHNVKESPKQTMFGFESTLLMLITDNDLKNYIIEQIDRVSNGLPIQNIRVKR